MIDLVSQNSRVWLEYFSLMVIQDTLFLVIILLLMRLIKNVPAPIKYWLGIVGLVKLILPPFISIGFFQLNEDSFIASGIFKGISSLGFLANQSMHTSESVAMSNHIDWISFLFLLWLAGIVIYFLIFLATNVRLWRVLRSARCLPYSDPSKHVNLKNIKIYISDRISMPLTIGFYPHRIFVPMVWTEWDDDCRRLIIQHELAHIYRYDNVVQFLQKIVQGIYFFNPLVYLLNNKLRLYREMSCDDRSVKMINSSPLVYAQYLTKIAEKAMWTTQMYHSASAFIRQRCELADRVKYQVKEEKMKYLPKNKIILLFVFLLLCIIPLSFHGSPVANLENKAKYDGQEVVKIEVKGKGNILIGDRRTSLENFRKTLIVMTEDSKEGIVLQLRFSDQVNMNVVFEVQRTVREINLLRVQYLSEGDKGLGLILPQAAPETMMKKIAREEDVLEIYINASGDISANGMPLPKTSLQTHITQQILENKYLIVAVRSDENAEFKDFITVLDHIRQAQAKRVVIYDQAE
jgi:beta-lactamase regulating signal transducer with metallopeptidase domain